MDEQQRLARLEAEVAYLRREKNVAVNALETAAALGHFHTSLSRLQSALPLLEETADKVRSLIRFNAVAIYLVKEEDADFYLSYADPTDTSSFFEREVAQLIEMQTFSWALHRDKALIVSSKDKDSELLLHSISTVSRTRGMFIGVLGQDKKDILDTSYALLSIILLSSASILESYELYRRINDINTELKQHVARLADSEKNLLDHRNRLEEEVVKRTHDLTKANHRLLQEVAERERAQQDLIAERDFITTVLDTAGALVVVLDRNGAILRFNRACEELSGYASNEVTGRLIWDLFVPKAEQAHMRRVFSSLKEGNFPNKHEGKWITRQGAHRYIAWNNSAITGLDGKVEYIIGTGIDITETLSATAALRDSEARFRAMFMNAGIGIALHDMDGYVLDCNPMFLQIMGYGRNELFQLRMKDILYKDDVPKKEAANEQLLKGTHVNLTMEKRYVRKDGAVRLCKTTMTLVRNHLRKPQYFVDLVEDVTEARSTQDALRQAERTYRNIFENAVEGIFIATADGVLHKVNPAMARMLGCSDPDALPLAEQTNLSHLTLEQNSSPSLFAVLRASGSVTNFEMQIMRYDNRKIWVSVSAWASRGPCDTISHIEGLMEDITERKLSEMRLQHKATIDELTSVPNRYLFLERLEQTIAHSERYGQSFALFYLDLDNFKDVNDQHGHNIGDLVLIEAASRLKARVRSSDMPARIGGDEFTLLLANVRSPKHVGKIAGDIVSALKAPYFPHGIRCVIGVSIGIGIYPEDGTTAEQLLHNADAAMYCVKQKGGNGFCFYSEGCGNVFSQSNKPR